MSNLGHDAGYYRLRNISLDERGPLTIDPTSDWGFNIFVWTASHDLADWDKGFVPRPVTVGPRAWIGSNVVLYNCVIGEGAIVAVGSVVRSCEVRPWTMVAGNPARAIARCVLKRLGAPWDYFDKKWGVEF